MFDASNGEMFTDEDIDMEIAEATTILIVQPLGDINTNDYAVEQKVQVCEVIQGNVDASGEIWIEQDNGISNGENWGMTNLMNSDFKYLVILNERNGSFFNQFIMGAIALNMDKTWNTIDMAKEGW